MLEILTQMGWPFVASIIGVAWAVAVPVAIRRTLRKQERIEELKLKRAIQLEAFKKGALTYTEEQ